MKKTQDFRLKFLVAGQNLALGGGKVGNLELVATLVLDYLPGNEAD